MKLIAVPPVVLLLVLGWSRFEVPDFNITRKQPNFMDFSFQVGFEERERMHDQFRVYDIAISIVHGRRKHIDPEAYIEVWDNNKFIYASALPQTSEDSLSITLQKKAETQDAMLFHFRINTRYVEQSWFNYQVLRDDGSVEMNCLIRLKDFIKVQPPGDAAPTTRDGRQP